MHRICSSWLLSALIVTTCPALANGAGIRLPGVDGRIIDIDPGTGPALTVICFLGTECPLAKLYGPRLATHAEEFQRRGVRFIGVNSNRQDSIEDVRRFAASHDIHFPIGKDYRNALADRFGVTRTPEVVVVDQHLTVLYRGRIDDQYLPGIAKPEAAQNYLRAALQQLLAGESVSHPVTEPVGCLIGRVKQSAARSDITFCDQVSRLLQKHCVQCHRPGEIGPFSLTDYEEVVGWADMIVEVVDQGRMPPWHATSEHAEFSNARIMPEWDQQALRDWVASGATYGDPADLPGPLEFTDGWNLPRQPDLVLAMRDRPFTVPADGTVEYQYFVVDPGFQEDKWVTAAEVIPGNRSVVHHSIVFVRPPDGARFRGVGWVTAYVPGQRPTTRLPGRAQFIPARSKLVFQQHYTPNGTEQQDLSKIGIIFGQDEDITHEVYSVVGIDQEFEIPPHAADFSVESKVRWIPDNGELLTIVPHMHLRGKSFRLFVCQDTRREILLDVPRYDFNWQHSYQLKQPLPLSSIDGLEFTVTFDNSAANPVNPDPNQHVTWGDQTWEEMAVAFFEVSQPREDPSKPNSRKPISQPQKDSVEKNKKVDKFVNRFMTRFDSNKDGEVERSETPLSLRAFGFWQYDNDGDGRLTRAEIRNAARYRLK